MWLRTANRLLNADKVESIEVINARDDRCMVHADGLPIADLPTRAEALRLLDAIEAALINALPVMDIQEELKNGPH